jgi:hypothetical protein
MASPLDPGATQLIFFPGIVESVAATGVTFFDATALTNRWFPSDEVTVVAGGLQVPLWVVETYGMTIPPPPPPMARVAGALATSETADRARIVVLAAALGAMAAVEAADAAAFISLGAMATVEAADTADFTALVVGQMAAVEAADTADFASVALGQMVAVEATDAAAFSS